MEILKEETFFDLIPKQKYLKFIEDGRGANKKCMSDSLLKMYTTKISKYNMYENDDVNYQMQNLIHHCNTKKKILYINSFLEMLCHFIIFDEAINIYNMLKNKLKISDLTIIKYIKSTKVYKNTVFSENINCRPQELGMEIIRAKVKKMLKKLNININQNLQYLDLCCGDGRKTMLFASYLKIKNIHGTDIELWGPYKKNRKLSFDFKFIKNNKLMYDDDSFDIVTCFLSLHHIPNLTNMINEVYRVLKSNGIFFIIEHDVHNFYDKLLIDIQHKLFAALYDNDMKAVITPDFTRYFNHYEWDFIMRNTGKFTFLDSGVYSESITLDKRYDKQFYTIFKKRGSNNKNFLEKK
jgi:ubiquinone/menaquinone biosynthesis C-methylase UbiE